MDTRSGGSRRPVRVASSHALSTNAQPRACGGWDDGAAGPGSLTRVRNTQCQIAPHATRRYFFKRRINERWRYGGQFVAAGRKRAQRLCGPSRRLLNVINRAGLADKVYKRLLHRDEVRQPGDCSHRAPRCLLAKVQIPIGLVGWLNFEPAGLTNIFRFWENAA
jgi:hypothetical protein